MPLGGAGAILKLKPGDLEPTPEIGDQPGLDAAKLYCLATGGAVHMGCGLDALSVGATGWGAAHPGPGTTLVRYMNMGIVISRFHMADGQDPTKVTHWDLADLASGIERTISLPNWSGILPLPIDLGVSGRYLKSNGVGVQPSWEALVLANALLDGANHTDTLNEAVLAGALIHGNATPKWARLPIGGAGEVLTVVGGMPAWSASPTAVLHNTLLHIKPIAAANCTWNNASTNISTSGDAFANVKVGDFIITGANSLGGNIGRKVQTWNNANSIEADSANTGSTLSGVTLHFIPGDHYDDSFSTDGLGAGLGYLRNYSRGNFSQAGPGTTFEELRGPYRWRSPGTGAGISTDFRVQGSSSTGSPFGFAICNAADSLRAWFHVGDLTTSPVLRLGNPASGDFIAYTGLAQDFSAKRLTIGCKIVVDPSATYTVFQSAANVDRLRFDVSVATAVRDASWPDYSGRVHVEGAPVTFTNGDTTPSVAGSRAFQTNNAAPTAITNFDDGVNGSDITVLFGDVNTTIADAGNFKLNGAVTSAVDLVMRFVLFGSTWVETSRVQL